MTMSWLADKKATTTAASAVAAGSDRGSVMPSARIASASPGWIANAQPRRRPRRLVTNGIGMRSMIGDHKNFTLYEMPTSAKRPIEVRDTPTSDSQNDRVPKVNANGSPLEN